MVFSLVAHFRADTSRENPVLPAGRRFFYYTEKRNVVPKTGTTIGDSPNDEPMFGFFPLSVGVANIQSQLHRIKQKPAFVTPSRGGAGFVEMADRLLAARRGHGG
jgi:3-deoxy-D-manno-octulosonate 8-phosphate phosphatase KdsC-like HAD superfamily phosphatase